MKKVIVHLKRPIPVNGMKREFTPEDHGENYKDVAQMFAKNYADNVDHIEDCSEDVVETKPIKKSKKVSK